MRLGEQAHRADRRLQLVAVLATKSRRICSRRSRSVMSREHEQREARRDARRAHDDETRLRRRSAARAGRSVAVATGSPVRARRARRRAARLHGQHAALDEPEGTAAADAARTLVDASTTTAASRCRRSTSPTPSGIAERRLDARAGPRARSDATMTTDTEPPMTDPERAGRAARAASCPWLLE